MLEFLSDGWIRFRLPNLWSLSLFRFSASPYCSNSLRVMNFAAYYLGIERQNCQFQPSSSSSLANDQQKETAAAAAATTAATTTSAATAPTVSMTEQELNVVALGLAYHDIGLFADGGSLEYLEPSVAVMEREIYVAGSGQKKDKKQPAWMTAAPPLPAFTRSDLATAREIILQHRKLTAWKQPAKEEHDNETTSIAADAALVNAVRQADWTDVTMGIVRYGMSPVYLETVYNDLPPLGFHGMLLGMCRRLSPHSLLGQLAVLKNLKW